MNRLLLLGCLAAPLAAQTIAVTPDSSVRNVNGANAFLATLDPGQRAKLMFAFDDEKQRLRWSNLPDSMAPRAGLKLGDLSAPQRQAAMDFLALLLSKQGYEKVLAIMEGDEVLKQASGGRGGMFGRDLFFISILGKPSAKDLWTVQFGGHHLALNLTISGRDGILTPSLTAAQPAKYVLNGKTIRPLGAEVDKAFALLGSLDDAQRKQAILNYQVADLVLGVGHDGKKIQPEGLKGSGLQAAQRKMLLDLIAQWVGIVNDTAAAPRMAQIEAALADTWFAWSGPTSPGSAAYFRIQGPTLVIEYAPQKMGGDPTMHIHTIYRDPTNDYGKNSQPR